ncbi:MAG: hypothetical protein KBT03_03880 [Bacteroidales bacterium]|nr:hypothetical protein [Candidatus Scybalousia scybalohippi]
MEYKTSKKLKDMICTKLDEIARMNALSNSDIEKLYMLVTANEKLLKSDEMEMGEYSGRRYSMDNNGSYTGTDYVYENGDSYRRGQSNRYSRADGADMTREHLRRMMSNGNMSEADRRTIERAMDML